VLQCPDAGADCRWCRFAANTVVRSSVPHVELRRSHPALPFSVISRRHLSTHCRPDSATNRGRANAGPRQRQVELYISRFSQALAAARRHLPPKAARGSALYSSVLNHKSPATAPLQPRPTASVTPPPLVSTRRALRADGRREECQAVQCVRLGSSRDPAKQGAARP